MKVKNKYPIIVVIGLALWLGESWYFGWNDKPENAAETFLDLLSGILVGWGILGDLLRNVQIHKHYEGDTINTQTTKYFDQRKNGVVTKNYSIRAATPEELAANK